MHHEDKEDEDNEEGDESFVQQKRRRIFKGDLEVEMKTTKQ